MQVQRYTLKVGNMAKPQDFVLYPYSGGDTIYLQSEKRWITANLRTGDGQINNKNKNYPNSGDLLCNAIAIKLPDATLKEIQGLLWHNDGKNGALKSNGVTLLTWTNKELFSNPGK